MEPTTLKFVSSSPIKPCNPVVSATYNGSAFISVERLNRTMPAHHRARAIRMVLPFGDDLAVAAGSQRLSILPATKPEPPLIFIQLLPQIRALSLTSRAAYNESSPA